MAKLLSDAELAEVEQYKFLSSGEARVIDILLDHIAALTEQHARDRGALAKDSYQLGHAAGDFIQQQEARIKTLETEKEQLIESFDALNDELDGRIKVLEETLTTIKQQTRLASHETDLGTATRHLIRIWDLVESVIPVEETQTG